MVRKINVKNVVQEDLKFLHKCVNYLLYLYNDSIKEIIYLIWNLMKVYQIIDAECKSVTDSLTLIAQQYSLKFNTKEYKEQIKMISSEKESWFVTTEEIMFDIVRLEQRSSSTQSGGFLCKVKGGRCG